MGRGASRKRRGKIQEALLEANVGCLLLLVLGMGAPFVAVGGFFVGVGLNSAFEQARLNGVVVSVPGKVVASEVRRTEAGSGTRTGMSSVSYWAHVEFIYEHAGVERTSDRVSAVGEGGRQAAMEAVVARYPAGKTVSAFVDPNDPDTAFLEKRWSQLTYVAAVGGCLPAVFVAGLAIVLAGWRRPGRAFVAAIIVGIMVLGVSGFAAAHYQRAVPSSEQMWWMWLVFGSAAVMVLALMLCLVKARGLHAMYIEAREEAEGGAGRPEVGGAGAA